MVYSKTATRVIGEHVESNLFLLRQTIERIKLLFVHVSNVCSSEQPSSREPILTLPTVIGVAVLLCTTTYGAPGRTRTGTPCDERF